MFRYEEFDRRNDFIRFNTSKIISDWTRFIYRCYTQLLLLSTCSTLLICALGKCEVRQIAIRWDTRYATQSIGSLRTRL